MKFSDVAFNKFDSKIQDKKFQYFIAMNSVLIYISETLSIQLLLGLSLKKYILNESNR